MTGLDKLDVEITVVLGKARMPLHQLLVLGRGAVIALDAHDGERVEILANGHLVAHGAVVVRGERIAVEVSALVRREAVTRIAGMRIGGGTAPAHASLPQAA